MPAKKAQKQLSFGFMKRKPKNAVKYDRVLAETRKNTNFDYLYRSGDNLFGVKENMFGDHKKLNVKWISPKPVRITEQGIQKYVVNEKVAEIDVEPVMNDSTIFPKKYFGKKAVWLSWDTDDYRRQGIAENVLRKALENAVKDGAKVAFAKIEEDNSASQALAKKLGFIKIGRTFGFSFRYYYLPLKAGK